MATLSRFLQTFAADAGEESFEATGCSYELYPVYTDVAVRVGSEQTLNVKAVPNQGLLVIKGFGVIYVYRTTHQFTDGEVRINGLHCEFLEN